MDTIITTMEISYQRRNSSYTKKNPGDRERTRMVSNVFAG